MTVLQIPNKIDKFLNEITRIHAPNASIRPKSESWLLKTISWFIKPFNPNFMTDFITTIGTTIWVPDNFFQTTNETDALVVITHETQHIIDLKKWGWLFFGLSYLFPFILLLLVPLALLSIWLGPIWLLWLLCLGFLAPIPSYGRYRLEINGYRTEQLFGKYVYKFNETDTKTFINDFIVNMLSGQSYYFAWPFTNSIRKRLNDWSWETLPRYQETLNWLKQNNLIN